jgi:hypothetical protein
MTNLQGNMAKGAAFHDLSGRVLEEKPIQNAPGNATRFYYHEIYCDVR